MRWRRASVCLAWAVAALFVATSAARLVPVVRDHLAATFDLMSEGPHMSTVKALERGDDIYDPRSFLDLPFYMTPYTPLYHVVVAALPQRAGNPFFTGRVVATVCMLTAAASLLFVAGRGQLPTALIALAAFFLIRAVTDNTAYLRSDALALCLSVWAVALVMRARSARAAAAVGALCALASPRSNRTWRRRPRVASTYSRPTCAAPGGSCSAAPRPAPSAPPRRGRRGGTASGSPSRFRSRITPATYRHVSSIGG